jgi:hypothetical protein
MMQQNFEPITKNNHNHLPTALLSMPEERRASYLISIDLDILKYIFLSNTNAFVNIISLVPKDKRFEIIKTLEPIIQYIIKDKNDFKLVCTRLSEDDKKAFQLTSIGKRFSSNEFLGGLEKCPSGVKPVRVPICSCDPAPWKVTHPDNYSVEDDYTQGPRNY